MRGLEGPSTCPSTEEENPIPATGGPGAQAGGEEEKRASVLCNPGQDFGGVPRHGGMCVKEATK